MEALLDYLQRFWLDLVDRTQGPMSFRFVLQPAMAFLAAAIDGFKDARLGRTPYYWRIRTADPQERRLAVREGTTAVARVLLLGVGMDILYQLKVFGAFRHPLETFVVAVLLAFVPYLLLRGPVTRVVRRWMARRSAGS